MANDYSISTLNLTTRIQLRVLCPHCGFNLSPLAWLEKPRPEVAGTAGTLPCESCGETITVTDDDVREAQHECLVALGEA